MGNNIDLIILYIEVAGLLLKVNILAEGEKGEVTMKEVAVGERAVRWYSWCALGWWFDSTLRE